MIAESIPWEYIGGGGATLAVLAAVWLNQRHVKEVVAEFSVTVRDANTKNKSLAEAFTETVTELSREARESHERCEQALQQLLRDQIPKRE